MLNITNGLVLYGPEMEPVKANILIEDDLIVEVSPHASEGREIDAKGCIVSPSLINSHVHLGDSVAKDIGDGEKIENIVKPPHGLKHKLLAKADRNDIISSIRSSMMEMLETGTTTLVDFREGGVEGLSLIEEASADVPIKKIVLGRHDSFLRPFSPESFSNSSQSNFENEIREASLEILEYSEGIGLSGFGEINDEIVRIITETCSRRIGNHATQSAQAPDHRRGV